MKATHLGAIAGAGIVLTLPVLILGVPFFSDDGVTHAMWYAHFSGQLFGGDLYPRWLMNMNAGLGSPVFFYYPPVPFFLTSLLRPFFAGDPQGWHQVGVSCSIALVASGIAAYFWLKDISDDISALVAAVLYMAMPYHLAEIYVRGALAELWAFVWMPLILFFINRVVGGRKLAFVGLAVCYALLIMTHLPTTLIFSVVPVGYTWFAAKKELRMKAVAVTSASLLIGIGLSAVYLLPALLTQQNVFIDRMVTGYFNYHNWFLFSKWSISTEDKLTYLLLAVDMIGIGGCSFFISKTRLGDRQRTLSRFWFAAAGVSVFMMTELSKPLWRIISPLRKIQFPWRFNVPLSISAAALLALALFSLRTAPLASGKTLKMTALALIVVWIPAMTFEAWRMFPQTSPDPTTSNAKNKQIELSRDAPEYRPRWNESMGQLDWNASMDIDNWDARLEKEFDSVLKQVATHEGSAPGIRLTEGIGQASVTARKPGEIDLHVETPTGAVLETPQFYFPYWTARLSGKTTNLTTSPSKPDGLLSFSVPPGSHDVELRLERSTAELAGQIVSLVSAAVTLTLALYFGYFGVTLRQPAMVQAVR
jgi:6-pyruvoyl-tetrahydropterin synthase related domain